MRRAGAAVIALLFLVALAACDGSDTAKSQPVRIASYRWGGWTTLRTVAQVYAHNRCLSVTLEPAASRVCTDAVARENFAMHSAARRKAAITQYCRGHDQLRLRWQDYDGNWTSTLVTCRRME